MSERLDAVDECIFSILREGPKPLRDVCALADLKYDTCRQRLDKLRRYNYIERPSYGVYALTDKGRLLIEDITAPIARNLKDMGLQTLIDLLPTELHRAFFRLVIAAVIAKHQLFESRESGYPAFVLGGRTKGFKTALAILVCHILGLNPADHIYRLFTAVPGEFGVRRSKSKGNQLDIDASPYFARSFICLDEFDKLIDRDTKRNVLYFLDGTRSFMVEDRMVENRACAMVTLNTTTHQNISQRFGLHDAYIRRNIVADIEHVRSELHDLDAIARRIFATKPFPKIDFQKLKLPRTKLVTAEYAVLDKMLSECVHDEFTELVETRPVEVLALGYSALLSDDFSGALFQTLWDRLICLESLGGTVTGWREILAKEWAAYDKVQRPHIMQQLQQAEKRNEIREINMQKRSATLEQKKAEQLESTYEFYREREQLVKEIKAEVQKLKQHHPELSKPLARMWRDIKTKAKTSESLAQYRTAFSNYMSKNVHPIHAAEKETKEIETQNSQHLLEINTLIAQIEDLVKKASRLNILEITSWTNALLQDIFPLKQKLDAGHSLSPSETVSLAVTRLSFEIRSPLLAQTITHAETIRYQTEKEHKHLLKQKRKELEKTNYYLKRKRLLAGEDPVLILQQIGVICATSYGKSSSQREKKLVEGYWRTNWLSGKPEYKPPAHDFKGCDGTIYKSFKEVTYWTNWPNMWPLLEVKKGSNSERNCTT